MKNLATGFRLLEVKFLEHPYLNNLNLKFYDDVDLDSEFPYKTVIIGPNGIGKSNILSNIIKIFRELSYIKINGKRTVFVDGKFQIKYLINSVTYFYSNYDENNQNKFELVFKINDTIVKHDDIILPQRLIANSISITDKYPYIKDQNYFPIYKYLGIRTSTLSAGTRSYTNRTVEYIIDSLQEKEFSVQLKEMLIFLGLKEKLEIIYFPRYRHHFFTSDLNETKFRGFFENYKKYAPNRKTQPWGTPRYDKIKKDYKLIEQLISFINDLSTKLIPYKDSKNSKCIVYDILNDKSLVSKHNLLNELYKLDIISFPEINLEKDNHKYSLIEGSSGEYHFVSSIIGILASVTNHSIVLIDEPEISLHPDWQMKYINFLDKCFKKFNQSHFIIATHSHFLISDLEDKTSTIIGLRREGSIKSEAIEHNTFGWSAEEVLYGIFNVASTRNKYLAQDISEILKTLSKSEYDVTSVKEKIKKVLEFKLELKDIDPLKKILQTLENKFLK
ncbi:MAG: AAA family ATPase [Ignavibacteria bacterium]|nr:AAA family ATPase [Ignavibacteria bacterium]